MIQDKAVDKTALRGIRVAAFTHFAAGPIAAQYLGALGADVIKVESPRRDLNRYAMRDVDDSLRGLSPHFICTNRNQRGIVLDLKSAAGLEAAQRLAASADVVLENYRPGVMRKLRLDFESVRRARPDIVYCSISAYDAVGSARDRPGQDLLVQALSGLASLSGRGGTPPVAVGAYVIDGFTAMQAVIGIVAALRHRDRCNEGQWIRTDMMSSALFLMTQEASFVMNANSASKRSHEGVAHVNHGAPYGLYEATDGVIAISVFGDAQAVRQLAQSIGVAEELAPYLTDRGLFIDRDKIAAAFARQIRRMTTAEATRRLTAGGAWVAPLRTLAEALTDPAVQETGVVREYAAPFVGKHAIVTEPLQMSATPLKRERPAPDHGEHTFEVLRELGYDEQQARTLAGEKTAP